MKRQVDEFLKDKNFTLGTHQPVIKAVLDVFKPSGVLELGTGLKSTPIFYEYGGNVVSIESDKAWYEKVSGVVGKRKGFKLIHHDIGYGVTTKTKYQGITNTVADECLSFYDKHVDDDMEFLFVDHVSGLRIITLRAMFNRFNVVAYHDAQHPGYRYRLLERENLSGYVHVMYKSLGVFTGVLVSTEYGGEMLLSFYNALEKYGKEYCTKFDVVYENKLEVI